MALVSTKTSQTLAALKRCDSTVVLKSSLLLPAFPENEKLCVRSTLLHYVARITSVRQSLSMSNKNYFHINSLKMT